MEGLDLVLFDLDGIATEQQIFWWEACGIVFARRGMPISHDKLLLAAQCNLYVEAMLEPFMPGSTEEHRIKAAAPLRQEIFPIYHALMSAHQPRWRQGAQQAIATVGQLARGRIGVVTSSWRKDVDTLATHLPALRSSFPLWITSDETQHLPDGKKPKSGGLLLAQRQLHEMLGPAEGLRVYVGDMLTDMLAAQEGNMAGILLEGPYTHPVARTLATVTIPDMFHLPDALQRVRELSQNTSRIETGAIQ